VSIRFTALAVKAAKPKLSHRHPLRELAQIEKSAAELNAEAVTP
jgi:hypothetical protein